MDSESRIAELHIKEVEDTRDRTDARSEESAEENPPDQVLPKMENVEKVVSTAPSKVSVSDVKAIPNGGLRAWLQVIGAFFLLFNNWGILNTFGAYQTYYETGVLFSAASSTISWIGSVQACLVLLVGAMTGPIYDAGYVKELLWAGAFFIVFGQMMLSLCHTFWQALLAQGICIGLGAGCLFVPGVAIISTYFNTRLAFAVGLAASGSSMGGILYPIVFHRLIGPLGFPWTTRVIGFIMLATIAIPLVVMRVRVLPAKKRKLYDLAALREPAYLFWTIGGVISFMGLYVPFFYIQYYAISEGITDDNLGFYLLAMLNAASVFGRIIPNFFADKTGPFNIIVPCAMFTGTLTLCLIAIHSLAGVIAFCVLYGFFSGTFVSLPPTVFVSLSPNRALIGTRMGMGFSIVSIGVLIGTPIAGAILSVHGFVGIWAFGGSMTLAGGLFMLLARMFQSKWSIVAKV